MAMLISLLVLIQFVVSCISQVSGNSCDHQQFTCNNRQCIQKEWWCDGRSDCRDGSDEQQCNHKNNNRYHRFSGCTSDQFDCKSPTYGRTRCIPMVWTCDGVSDCTDGSDEKLDRCIPKRSCTSEEFKCRNGLCIPLHQVCDGANNCRDNTDENCWIQVPSLNSTKLMKDKLSKFLSLHQPPLLYYRDPHRYIITLFFANSTAFNSSRFSQEMKLLIKEVDFETTMALYKNQSEQLDATHLALYIHSQLAICSNPRNFFGTDLVSLLEKKVEKSVPGTYSPLVSLALCNSGVNISSNHIKNLDYFLNHNSTETFITDMKALSILAITCLRMTNHSLSVDIRPTLSYLKSQQENNGSFKNLRSTAVIVQALLAAKDNGIGWNLTKAIEYLASQQLPNGSFGDVLNSYLIAPILNGQSFLQLYNRNCISNWTNDMERKKELENLFRKKIEVSCSIWIGHPRDSTFTLGLRVPSNITMFDFMLLAAKHHSCFKIESDPKGINVYSICNHHNNLETMEYWQLFQVVNRTLTPLGNAGLASIPVEHRGLYVFWLTKPKNNMGIQLEMMDLQGSLCDPM